MLPPSSSFFRIILPWVMRSSNYQFRPITDQISTYFRRFWLTNDSLDGMRISCTKRDEWSRQPVAKESASSDITLEFSYFTTVKIVTAEIYASVLGTSRHRGKQRACGNDGAVTFGRKKVEVVVPLLDILRNYLVLGILTCFFVTAARIYGHGRGQLRFSVLT